MTTSSAQPATSQSGKAANGLLDPIEGEIIRELKPEDYAIAKIPVEWKGVDAERGTLGGFVTTSIADQDRKTAQEYAGYTPHSNRTRTRRR